MVKFVDDNHVDGEMSDADFQLLINEESKRRDLKIYGRDGHHPVYREQFTYRGIPYLILIQRYYQIGVPLKDVRGMNGLGKWALLEPTGVSSDIHKKLEEFDSSITGVYDWLYRDTLHSGQENWSLRKMVDQMHLEAHECIDEFPNIIANAKRNCDNLIQKLWDELLPFIHKNLT